MIVGFTFPLGKRDVFIETTRRKKINKFASEIIRELVNIGYDIPDNPDIRAEILYYLQKATLEPGKTSTGVEYYKLNGEKFAMTTFPDDVIIIKV